MPRQQVPDNRPPYTKVLSALRKNELVRLCLEFGLSNEGSVVVLRTRLKDYLNLHRETAYRNPRYKALFPKHRRFNQPPSSRSPTPGTRSSPPVSDRSPSPALSYASWDGIIPLPHNDNPAIYPQQPPIQPPYMPLQLQAPVPLHNSPPPPSISSHDHESPPPVFPPVGGRKLYTPPFICYFLRYFSQMHTHYMC